MLASLLVVLPVLPPSHDQVSWEHGCTAVSFTVPAALLMLAPPSPPAQLLPPLLPMSLLLLRLPVTHRAWAEVIMVRGIPGSTALASCLDKTGATLSPDAAKTVPLPLPPPLPLPLVTLQLAALLGAEAVWVLLVICISLSTSSSSLLCPRREVVVGKVAAIAALPANSSRCALREQPCCEISSPKCSVDP